MTISWLNKEFNDILEDAKDEVLQQPAYAHIFKLLGGMLICDTSGGSVHLMYMPLLEDLEYARGYRWALPY